jgi:hypothetical protein
MAAVAVTHEDVQNAIHTVTNVKIRLKTLWPSEVDDLQAVLLGVAGTLAHPDCIVDLSAHRTLQAVLNGKLDHVKMNDAEFVLLCKCSALSGSRATLPVVSKSIELHSKVVRALECTLAESASAELWKRPAVQNACLLSFFGVTSPVAALDAIFGSIVRSDIRRVEDLHFETTDNAADSVFLFNLAERVAKNVLRL